ncbi:MAG: diaminopimelate epimerase [Nitrospiria bacterium]
MNGSGNDFVMIDHRKPTIPQNEMASFISKVCRRGLSVGADGLILVVPSSRADYGWHFYNADGGEAEMCANGSRCVARFAFLMGIAPAKHTIETIAGIVRAEVRGEEGCRVQVYLPDPFDLHLNVDLEVNGEKERVHSVNTSVPHAVYFVDDTDKVDLVSLGSATRYHEHFAPKGTNVNIVSFSGDSLKIRTYERGVEDETLACGTGAVAGAVIAASLGKVSSPVTLLTRGGTRLVVTFAQDGASFKNISLEGDARVVSRGEISEDALI